MGATFIKSEDCMGNSQTFWRAERVCSDGKLILGVGATEQQANEDAERNRERHEVFCKKTLLDQLSVLAAGKLLDSDQQTAIRLITQILEKNRGVINV